MKTDNNKIDYVLILVFLMTSLMACEGYECSDGIVYDSESKLPIDSVLCVSNGGAEVYTDSDGRYEELCSPFGGCMPKCSELKIEFSKKGYKNLIEAKAFDTIYLEKIDTVNH